MNICPICGTSDSKHWVTCKKYPETENTGIKSQMVCMHHCKDCEDFSGDYDFRCKHKTEEERQMAIEYTRCQRCGDRFPKGNSFCPNCGEKQVDECQSCWMMNGKSFNCKQRICPGHKLPILISNDASLKGETNNV